MNFAWPWCFLLLPWPWLLGRLRPPAPAQYALRVPVLPVGTGTPHRPAGRTVLLGLAWLCLVVAAARPQQALPEREPLPRSRSLMLALDLSASMQTADFLLAGHALDRLALAKQSAAAFFRDTPGERIGLIVFGSQAYLHTPLTTDTSALVSALDLAEVGLAGRETALGDALALGVKALQDDDAAEKRLIVLTDGAQTRGTLSPEQAIWLARRAGIRVDLLGLHARPDPDTTAQLQALAGQAEGRYLPVLDSRQLAEYWRDLARPADAAVAAPRPVQERYPWPLALGLVCLALQGLLTGLAARPGRHVP